MSTSKKSKQLSISGNFGLDIPVLKDCDDLLIRLGHQIEKLDSVRAKEIMHYCSEARGFNAFVLGGVLVRIAENNWFEDYGYTSFSDLVTNGLGMSTSTAYDYKKIYVSLIEADVPWEKVEHIGWTKLRWIARYIEKDNVDQWVEAAANMNTHQLHEFAKTQAKEVAEKSLVPKFLGCTSEKESTHVDTTAANDDASADTDAKQEAPMVTEKAALETPQTKIFKLYPGQLEVVQTAIECVVKESGGIAQNEALTRICMQFLSTYEPDEDGH